MSTVVHLLFELSASFLDVSYLNAAGHPQSQHRLVVSSSMLSLSLSYGSCFAISICYSSIDHSKGSSRPEAVAAARTLLLVHKSKPGDK